MNDFTEKGRYRRTFSRPTFSPVRVEVFDGFVRGFCAGAHHDDDALGIGSANVIEQVILASDELGELVHRCLHFGRSDVVVGIGALANLEEDVGILRRAAQHRMIGRERALAVLDDAIHVDHGAHVVFVEHFDLVDFVRGAESVEEMQEGNARFERWRRARSAPGPSLPARSSSRAWPIRWRGRTSRRSDRRKSRARALPGCAR